MIALPYHYSETIPHNNIPLLCQSQAWKKRVPPREHQRVAEMPDWEDLRNAAEADLA